MNSAFFEFIDPTILTKEMNEGSFIFSKPIFMLSRKKSIFLFDNYVCY